MHSTDSNIPKSDETSPIAFHEERKKAAIDKLLQIRGMEIRKIIARDFSRSSELHDALARYLNQFAPNVKIRMVHASENKLYADRDTEYTIPTTDSDVILEKVAQGKRMIVGEKTIYIRNGKEWIIIEDVPSRHLGVIARLLQDNLPTLIDKHQLMKLSYIDPLTGIGNIHDYRKTVEEIEADNGSQYAILRFDLDNFKLVNDTYGHDKGDIILQDFSQILKETFKRETDKVFRMGGDEFAVIIRMPNKTSPEAQKVVIRQLWKSMNERLDLYNNTTLPTRGIPLYKKLKATYGLAFRSEEKETVVDVMKKADKDGEGKKSPEGTIRRFAQSFQHMVRSGISDEAIRRLVIEIEHSGLRPVEKMELLTKGYRYLLKKGEKDAAKILESLAAELFQSGSLDNKAKLRIIQSGAKEIMSGLIEQIRKSTRNRINRLFGVPGFEETQFLKNPDNLSEG